MEYVMLQQTGTVDAIASKGSAGRSVEDRRLKRKPVCVQFYCQNRSDLGEGAETEPLESEKGEAGTLPSTGRKYLR